MLDKKTSQMLELAALLEETDLDEIRQSAAGVATAPHPTDEAIDRLVDGGSGESADSAEIDLDRGERERQRTRESKVSTACLGQPRESHTWWPLNTELIGRIGAETFTARVVENPQVKSGRSLLITSGAANGRVCITPTRAAIEATEAHRQAQNLGRGGGVTNGWSFWTPKR